MHHLLSVHFLSLNICYSVNYRFSCMNLLTASYAASSSAPSNVKVTSWPFFTPSPISARSFLQSTFFPSFSIEIVDSKPFTSFTSFSCRTCVDSFVVCYYILKFFHFNILHVLYLFSLLFFVTIIFLLLMPLSSLTGQAELRRSLFPQPAQPDT